MKFTLSWLKEHLETEATLDEIVEALNMIGLEVEDVDDKAALKPFVIARVLTAEQHPDADRLKVLTVDAGSGDPVQVVCGAPNARAGLIGAFAPPGTYIPGIDLMLAVGKIRGVESHGMMCSERELQMSDEHEGIIDLQEELEIGSSFAAYAGLDDPVIEIGLTPNRPDCTGVRGIARDLAAYGLGTLKDDTTPPAGGTDPCPVGLSLEFGDTQPLCLGFALRMVKGVKNGPSPQWMQKRLTAIGLRPINALVDITNYVTFDRGRPLHVFDAGKVHGDLVVRRGRDGEKVLALDEREYEVNDEICVIADDEGVESLAGIMGGERSGCDGNTTDVLIESALWDPYNIARTGRDLGIITDARYRFERGVDPAYMAEGMEYATKLVLQLCGGEPTKPVIAGYSEPERKVVPFPVSEVGRLTGTDVPREEALAILSRLGFEPAGDSDTVNVSVPTWRPDIDGKADLVEEVMRIYGVNRIDPQPLPRNTHINERILTTLQIRTRSVRRALAARGMLEAVNWSFIAADSGGAVRRWRRGAEACQSDCGGHVRHAALAAAGAARQRTAQCRPRPCGHRPLRGVRHLRGRDLCRPAPAGRRRAPRHGRAGGKRAALGRLRRARRRLRCQGGRAGRARGLRRAGRPRADRGRRPGLVSPRPQRRHQARAEGCSRHVRRVPPQGAGPHGCGRAGLRLRDPRRCGAGAEAQGDPHQDAA